MKAQQRTILLTGATGCIGQALLKAWTDHGTHVVAMARKDRGLIPCDDKRVRFVRGDIRLPRFGLSIRSYKALASDCDAVVHCAAQITFTDPYDSLYRTNVVGTRQVMRFARRTRETRFDHFSTAYVGGREANLPFLNHYEKTKWIAEQRVLAAFHTGQLTGKILRPSIVTPPFPSTSSLSLNGLWGLIGWLARRRPRRARGPISIAADPNARLHFVRMDYVIQAALRLCNTDRGDGKPYLLIPSLPPTNRELLAMIARATGVQHLSIRDTSKGPQPGSNPQEQSLARLLRPISEYLFDRRSFDDREIDSVMDRSALPPADLSQEELDAMVERIRNRHENRTKQTLVPSASPASPLTYP